jgi:competence protein ComEA
MARAMSGKAWTVASLLVLHGAACALDVNAASQAELEQLRGIGVSLSERLIAERAKRPFADWADLMRRLPGLGPRQASRLSSQGLTVGDRAYPSDNPASAPTSESR